MKPRLAATALVAASACALALGACTPGDTAQSSSSPAAKGGGDGNYTIAVVPKDATNPWFVRMETGVKKYAEDTGMNAFQKGPAETDATMQAQVIQDLIAQGVDAICVVPVDPGAIEPVLKQAMDAGIVVVTHEGASQQNTMYDIEAFNNSEYGAFIMDNLAQAMGEEGVYTTMVGHVTNASHNEWADGAVAHQKEKYPKMTLLEAEPRVESQDNGETAYQTAKEVLEVPRSQGHPRHLLLRRARHRPRHRRTRPQGQSIHRRHRHACRQRPDPQGRLRVDTDPLGPRGRRLRHGIPSHQDPQR